MEGMAHGVNFRRNRWPLRRAGLGGGGAKALAGTLVLDGVKVNGNSGSDGGALEVAEQAGSVFGIKTQLNVTVRRAYSRGSGLLEQGAENGQTYPWRQHAPQHYSTRHACPCLGSIA